jgi:hypothetical protein
MPKKLQIEDCHKLAESRGGKCLSTEYIQSMSKLTWQCFKGHDWIASYNSINNGNWCPHCNIERKKNTIEDCHKIAESKGGKCLSTEYINSRSKLTWQCSEGHKFINSYNRILMNEWCYQCKYIVEEIKDEVWKVVSDNSNYSVSNFGRVMRTKNGIKRILKILINTSGYANTTKLRLIHRWVAKCFIPNPLNKLCVNHLDGNKLNNHVSNLEWCTTKENIHHALRTGLKKQKKIYQIDVKTNTIIKEWEGSYQIQKELNVDAYILLQALRLKHKVVCLGFKWQYKDEYDQELQDKKTNNNGNNGRNI